MDWRSGPSRWMVGCGMLDIDCVIRGVFRRKPTRVTSENGASSMSCKTRCRRLGQFHSSISGRRRRANHLQIIRGRYEAGNQDHGIIASASEQAHAGNWRRESGRSMRTDLLSGQTEGRTMFDSRLDQFECGEWAIARVRMISGRVPSHQCTHM